MDRTTSSSRRLPIACLAMVVPLLILAGCAGTATSPGQPAATPTAPASAQPAATPAPTLPTGQVTDLEVVAQVGRGDEVLDEARRTSPDVAPLDIEMPGLDGLSAAAILHEALPDCRVLILTTFGRLGYLQRAMEHGAAGFLLKDAPAADLADAIRRAMLCLRTLDPGLAVGALSEGRSPLTEREREVLSAAGVHPTVEAIAEHLFLSEGTVRNHLFSAIQKLGAQNRAEAVKIASQKGWLDPSA